MYLLSQSETKLMYKLLNLFIVFSFLLTMGIFPSGASAQTILNLPAPGTMIMPSSAYAPAIVAGITIDPDNPLQLDFIIDAGEDNLKGEELRLESRKLINYFLATLTVPEDEMWVNLSPYEKDRIVAQGLGKTEMGRDMLAQDYLLKQLTASLMYPEEEIGEKFWKKIHAKAQARLGGTDIPTNTFNKVWIVPDKAIVYVNGTNVFVSESHLKVFLEEDYLSMESNIGSTKHGLGEMTKSDIEQISEEAKEMIREVILPEIEREINQGKNFASLRQIFNSMILATWYKKNLRQSVLGAVYADANKTSGIEIEDKQIKEKIYQQYVEAFKTGVYDYIKEDYDLQAQEIVTRKYFSGGIATVEEAMIYEGGVEQRDNVEDTYRYDKYGVRANFNMTGAQGNRIEVTSDIGEDAMATEGGAREEVDDSATEDEAFLSEEVREKITSVIKKNRARITKSFRIYDIRHEDELVALWSDMEGADHYGLSMYQRGKDLIMRRENLINNSEGRDLILDRPFIGGEIMLRKRVEDVTEQDLQNVIDTFLSTPVPQDQRVQWFNRVKSRTSEIFNEAIQRSGGRKRDIGVESDMTFWGTNWKAYYLAHEDAKRQALYMYVRWGRLIMKTGRLGQNSEGYHSWYELPLWGKTVFKKRAKDVTDQDIEGVVNSFLEQASQNGWLTSAPTAGEETIAATSDLGEDSMAYLEGEEDVLSKKAPGGIDFNPNMLELSQDGQALDFALDNSLLETLRPDAVQGIQPVIINIVPITNFAPLLGKSDEPETQKLSRL